MRERRLAAKVYAALKAATEIFVDTAFGGQKVAAGATRVEQQAISSYCSREAVAADKFMPIDVLVDLMDASGDTSLLRHIAEQAGCLLVPLPKGRGNAAVTERSSRTAKEFGDVMAGVLTALGDGRITMSEREHIDREIYELMLELAGLAEAVKAATVGDDA